MLLRPLIPSAVRRAGLPSSLLIDGSVFPSQKPRIDVIRPSTLRGIAGDVPKGAGLLTGRTKFGNGFSLEYITTVTTAPLRHVHRLLTSNNQTSQNKLPLRRIQHIIITSIPSRFNQWDISLGCSLASAASCLLFSREA
jgi:hypothetical protein